MHCVWTFLFHHGDSKAQAENKKEIGREIGKGVCSMNWRRQGEKERCLEAKRVGEGEAGRPAAKRF